ncbi:hypothetical protein [Colwellia sp. UCD-KL20]|uniref:hypothetical protein n=1 Tax=Colwellia sp. UCD-KL20 TaxID=1917165 RepID=UPI000970B33A|nr:hypothetical protein [Colwellia sp. UCD-KL20]
MKIEKEIRTHLLDASALVKLFIEEDGSKLLREYYDEYSVFWTTTPCLIEVLGILKCKYLYKSQLTKNKYLEISAEIMAYFRNKDILIVEDEMTNLYLFNQVEIIVGKYSLDIIDAFQLVTLQNGFSSKLTGEAKTILITADGALEKAATLEGLRVWNCLKPNLL